MYISELLKYIGNRYSEFQSLSRIVSVLQQLLNLLGQQLAWRRLQGNRRRQKTMQPGWTNSAKEIYFNPSTSGDTEIEVDEQ